VMNVIVPGISGESLSSVNSMILKQVSAKEIENQARSEGLIGMKQDGFLKAIDGITTIEEVLRVAEV